MNRFLTALVTKLLKMILPMRSEINYPIRFEDSTDVYNPSQTINDSENTVLQSNSRRSQKINKAVG